MLAAGISLAYVAAVPAWLMRQTYHVFVFGWTLVLIGWLAALALAISLGFRKKMILVIAFFADIEWGWVPKNSQPPGEVNTKNYQNDFFKGGKHGKHNRDTIYSATCMGEGPA